MNNPFRCYDKDNPHYELPLRPQTVGFLVWLRRHYGQFIAGSYIDMATAYGKVQYVAVRSMIIELMEAKYLILRDPDRKHRRYKIDDEKYRELCHIVEKEVVNPVSETDD